MENLINRCELIRFHVTFGWKAIKQQFSSELNAML